MMNSGDKLAGFVGQSMGGPKVKRVVPWTAPASSGALPPVPFGCIAEAFLIAAGGGPGTATGGGGGGAAFTRFSYGPGVTGTYIVGAGVAGADGGDTSVTVNGVVIALARGGPSVDTTWAARGGTRGIGEIIRSGGDPGVAPTVGDYGIGPAKVAAHSGASAGFIDLIGGGPLAGGAASSGGANGGFPGGGAGSGNSTFKGGDGALYIVFREL